MKLVIVESPTKAKTLSRFLGKGYEIMASMGHVRDLPRKKMSVDTENGFKPSYEIMPGKKNIIADIKSAGAKAAELILATDPDREGEAIAYHVAYLLKKSQNKIKTVRITFHEITKEAVAKALGEPGIININLVHAQQARRVLDRLVGYKLSPVLWRKVRRGLSAGRVQSVAVRLVVDREREINAFVPENYWEFYAKLYKENKNKHFTAKLIKINDKNAKVGNSDEAERIEQELKKALYKIADIKSEEARQNPVPPFITSTLQRSASNLFHFSAKKTMSTAQRLYEAGLITYHRTDSLALSVQALDMLRAYIKTEYGGRYLPDKPRLYKTKAKSAQEAHESIRPTRLDNIGKLAPEEEKLFELIKKRALSSQMASSVYKRLTIDVSADKYLLRKNSQELLFDGYLAVWGKKIEEDPELINIGDLSKGDKLNLSGLKTEAKQTQPPGRYTEAGLIKALEERGIGRPSTYAPIISTIQLRQYVEKESGSFSPTSVGTAVTGFLEENFPKVMDYQFTAQMEDELDSIAGGRQKWQDVIGAFYRPFSGCVEEALAKAKRVEIPTEKTGQKCPECGKGEQVIRVGRFGKFLSCSRFPDCGWKAVYKEVIQGVKCPDCGGEILVRQTKKGKRFYGCSNYPKCKWASWRKPK